MTPKLKEAALTINELAKREEDVRLKLCRAIAAAMDLVKKESNLKWTQWADQHLRKPDGSKWSHWTLYSYASFGRDPKKLDHLRKSVASNGRNARKALNTARASVANGRSAVVTSKPSRSEPEIPQARPSEIILNRQVESLMFAWKNASAEARKIFLERVADQKAA